MYNDDIHVVVTLSLVYYTLGDGGGQWGETTILPTHSVLPMAIAPLVWWLQVIWLVV